MTKILITFGVGIVAVIFIGFFLGGCNADLSGTYVEPGGPDIAFDMVDAAVDDAADEAPVCKDVGAQCGQSSECCTGRCALDGWYTRCVAPITSNDDDSETTTCDDGDRHKKEHKHQKGKGHHKGCEIVQNAPEPTIP